jgi:hypothetical protein
MLYFESGAFDLAGQPSHDMAYVAAAHSSALYSYTLSFKAFSKDDMYPGLLIFFFLKKMFDKN